jgi:hypothetical protein
MSSEYRYSINEKVGVWPLTTFTGIVIGEDRGGSLVVDVRTPAPGKMFMDRHDVLAPKAPETHGTLIRRARGELESRGFVVLSRQEHQSMLALCSRPDAAETLIDLALGMAQDLRKYADAAKDAGENIEATSRLLERFDAWTRDTYRSGPVDFLSQALNEGDGVYRP